MNGEQNKILKTSNAIISEPVFFNLAQFHSLYAWIDLKSDWSFEKPIPISTELRWPIFFFFFNSQKKKEKKVKKKVKIFFFFQNSRRENYNEIQKSAS